MNRNLACYFALLVLSLYIEHDRAANIGGSHLQNPVKFGSTILPTSFTMITSSSPLPSQRTTTAGLLASSGPNNFTVQAGSKITLQCQVDQLVDNATTCLVDEATVNPCWCTPSVVIIGAGLAGLSAAQHLFSAGITDVTILEATDRPGGRVHSCWLGETVAEIGAIYIEESSMSNSITGLAAQQELFTKPTAKMSDSKLLSFTSEGDVVPSDIAMAADACFTGIVKQVSWLRRFGDSLILVSVGKEMYSSDPRFTSIFLSSQDWRLHIDGVNVTDQGHYECQISSHPPVVRSVYLHVLVPKLEIEDERSLPIKNKFYNSGSTIELKCVISKVPQPTQFIIWKHNSTILNYDTTRGGISVKTDILPDGAESQLNIANVGPTDSGNYTCSLGESAVTSVSVVVITGETPAAMQQGCAKSRVSYGLLLLAVDMAAWSSFS